MAESSSKVNPQYPALSASADRDRIDQILKDMVYDTHHFPGTNYTVAIAKDPRTGFVYAMGVSSCVDSSTFNAADGNMYAIRDCQAKAKEKVWELEGYYAYKKNHPDH